MKKLYFLFLTLICFSAMQVNAQRTIDIPPSSDPSMLTDIIPFIMGDTTATGERVDMNTIYTLENGVAYITSDQITNREWHLQLQAKDLSNTDVKPVLLRVPNASGGYPNVLRAFGDVTFKNIWFIPGEKGPGEQMDWGKIRYMGDSLTIVIDECIFEKDRGGFIQMRGNYGKVYLSNTIFRNAANHRQLEGNGRGFDARTTVLDTLVVKNCVFHNLVDRVFRSQGGALPHNYIEFDQCTVFNHGGRHGTFQFGKVLDLKITNNVLENPNMSGTTPQYTDEQTQPDNEAHHVFTIDTLYGESDFIFENNNIYYTQDVLDFYAGIDSVSKVEVYSQLILDKLGAEAPSTYFEEVLNLSSVPSRTTFLQYYKDLYADPSSGEMQDIVVQDISRQGTAWDLGYIFDFSTFSPCYDPSAQSATANSTGGAIGADYFCDLLNNTFETEILETLNLQVNPNPASSFATISFDLPASGPVRLSVYDLTGRLVSNLVDGNLPQGIQQVDWQRTQDMNPGFYVVRLQTQQGELSLKMIVQ